MNYTGRERRSPSSKPAISRLESVRIKLRTAIAGGFAPDIAQMARCTKTRLNDIANAQAAPKGAALSRLEGTLDKCEFTQQ